MIKRMRSVNIKQQKEKKKSTKQYHHMSIEELKESKISIKKESFEF